MLYVVKEIASDGAILNAQWAAARNAENAARQICRQARPTGRKAEFSDGERVFVARKPQG